MAGSGTTGVIRISGAGRERAGMPIALVFVCAAAVVATIVSCKHSPLGAVEEASVVF